MADYALVLRALDEHVGSIHSYAGAYGDSIRDVLADRALSDPFTAALIKHAKAHKGKWRGPAIKSQAETLRAAGLVAIVGRSHGKRYIELELIKDDQAEAEPATVVPIRRDEAEATA